MKKKLYSIVIFIFTLFISVNYVYADTFELSLTGEDTFQDTIVLKLKVNSLTGFNKGLYGLDTTINFDSHKISLEKVEGLNNFDVTYDISSSNKIVAYSHIGVTSNKEILTLTFKNNTLKENESTEISFTNSVASDGENDINGTIISKTITNSTPEYEKGDMDRNGKIGLADVVYLLKVYLGVEEATDMDNIIGDMNSDGKISLQDIIMLLKKYLGIS